MTWSPPRESRRSWPIGDEHRLAQTADLQLDEFMRRIDRAGPEWPTWRPSPLRRYPSSPRFPRWSRRRPASRSSLKSRSPSSRVRHSPAAWPRGCSDVLSVHPWPLPVLYDILDIIKCRICIKQDIIFDFRDKVGSRPSPRNTLRRPECRSVSRSAGTVGKAASAARIRGWRTTSTRARRTAASRPRSRNRAPA